VSVSEIAAQYGGGGHTHAAGFSIAISNESTPLLNPVLDFPVLSSSALS
jgi:nanoRNase/pAp phosphatase (c-di-AMP/oligoRNAs hydrolase)